MILLNDNKKIAVKCFRINGFYICSFKIGNDLVNVLDENRLKAISMAIEYITNA